MSALGPTKGACPVCRELVAQGAQLQLDVSNLKFDNESIVRLVQSLALETHHFAAARNLGHFTAGQLSELVLCELQSNLSDLLDVRCVFTGKAPCIGSLSVGFSDEVYRRVAEAAKHRVLNIVDGDGNA
ncbi:hypothetical protein [Pseudophaeobacter sp.]|jgi:hypothetical protein|uniref:hypothetical protein n=1 Tax=Pseudophaeobacter sp. TaxID=1971739 RepID=UPI0032D8ECA3